MPNRALSGRCDWLRRRCGKHKWQFLLNIKAGLANKLGDRSGIEPCSVVLHAEGAISQVKAKATDAVDIFCGAQRSGHRLSGRRCVAIEDFHRSHKEMIASRELLVREQAYKLLR